MFQLAQKEGVKPILFDFDDDDDEPSTANAGDNINEDSKENEKKIVKKGHRVDVLGSGSSHFPSKMCKMGVPPFNSYLISKPL